MTELETQLLRIIEEHSSNYYNNKAVAAATAEFRRDAKKIIKPYQHNQRQWRAYRKLVQTQKSLATTQTQFHELERNTATYIEQINGKVKEMSKITTTTRTYWRKSQQYSVQSRQK
jgi:uncharacterized protein HemX